MVPPSPIEQRTPLPMSCRVVIPRENACRKPINDRSVNQITPVILNYTQKKTTPYTMHPNCAALMRIRTMVPLRINYEGNIFAISSSVTTISCTGSCFRSRSPKSKLA